jgi:hypothetical protein
LLGNAFVDYESAPVPPTGMPTHEITPAAPKHEKELFTGPPATQDVTVTSAGQALEGEESLEPTEEEYKTLRK